MLWMLAFAIPMAYLIGACLSVIPADRRKISPTIGWLLIVPALLSLASLIPLSALSFFMVAAGALALYYAIRTVAFLGMDASYSAFTQAFNMALSPLHTYLAWLLAFVEPLLMLGLFVYAIATGHPGNPLTARGMGEVIQLVTMIIAAGLGLSYLYLIGMFGNRARIAKRAPPQKGAPLRKDAPKGTTVTPKGAPPAKSPFKGPPPRS